MLLIESVWLIGFYIDHADDFVFCNEWHRQLRTGAGCGINEVRLRRDVVYQHRLAELNRTSGDALSDLNAYAFRHLRWVSHLEADPQLLVFLVQQQDCENLIVDE